MTVLNMHVGPLPRTLKPVIYREQGIWKVRKPVVMNARTSNACNEALMYCIERNEIGGSVSEQEG